MGGTTGVMRHNRNKRTFDSDLIESKEYERFPFWERVYQKAFSGKVLKIEITGDNLALQSLGVDKVITLQDRTTITVDEKYRPEKDRNGKEQNYYDIALEYLSARERNTPGWIEKDLKCDYIAYAIAFRKVCYLIPYKSLRGLWIYNAPIWRKDGYRIATSSTHSKNGTLLYHTDSLCVPIKEIMERIPETKEIYWG